MDPVATKIEQLVSKSDELSEWLYERIDGSDVPSDLRGRMAGGCFSIVLQHRTGIVLLVKNGVYGPAFALIRVIYETYVRGVWLFKCASDAELNRYKLGQSSNTFEQLVTIVEGVEGFDVGVLSDVKKRSWRAMNSFTHTGYEQIVRHQTEDSIEPNYDPLEVVEVVNFATAMAFLSAIAISDLAGRTELGGEILTKVKDFIRLSPA